MTAKKISVLTGTRADFGLLSHLIRLLEDSPYFTVEIIATGTHFSAEFGETWKQIVEDGFEITHKVEILSSDDSDYGVAVETGNALSKFAYVFNESRPDLLLVLGDRYEAFAAASAAFLMRIPIAHIAGGEVTEGALDDSLRHAITKFSNLHFVSAEPYRTRVIQLGEHPESVFNFGAIGLDNFENIKTLNIQELSDFLNFEMSAKDFILVTVHPETASEYSVEKYAQVLFEALDHFQDRKVLLTGANADAGGRQLNTLLMKYSKDNPHRVVFRTSLGQRAYLSAMQLAAVILGNSSSGILEAPTAGTPTVNIGDRQKGRLRAPSVIDVKLETHALINALEAALQPSFQQISALKESPFGTPGVSEKICEVLQEKSFSFGPKTFVDMEES